MIGICLHRALVGAAFVAAACGAELCVWDHQRLLPQTDQPGGRLPWLAARLQQ